MDSTSTSTATAANEHPFVSSIRYEDGYGAVSAEPVHEEDDIDDQLKNPNAENLPTIDLSSWEEFPTAVVAQVKDCDDDFPEKPTVVADPLATSFRDVEDDTEHGSNDLEVGCRRRLESDGDLDNDNNVNYNYNCKERRAEFISTTFFKASVEERLGLQLYEDEPRIAAIDRTSKDALLSGAPLQPGDVLISINTKRCIKMTSHAICALLRASTGDITIVVQNEGGSADLVESTVTKQSVDEKCGLGFRFYSRGNGLKLHAINPDGKFACSLLNPGDKIIYINDCYCGHIDAVEAANIVRSEPKHVRIVAKTCHERGVVVAEVKKNKTVRCLQLLMMKSSIWSPPNTKAPLTPAEKSNRRLAKFCAIVFIFLIAVIFLTRITRAHQQDRIDNDDNNIESQNATIPNVDPDLFT